MDLKDNLLLNQYSDDQLLPDASSMSKENYFRTVQTPSEEALVEHSDFNVNRSHDSIGVYKPTGVSQKYVAYVSESGKTKGLSREVKGHKCFDVKVEHDLDLISKSEEKIACDSIGTESDECHLLHEVKEDIMMKCEVSESSSIGSNTDTIKESKVNVDGQMNIDLGNKLLCNLEIDETVLKFSSSEDASANSETIKECFDVNKSNELMNNVRNHFLWMMGDEGASLDYHLEENNAVSSGATGLLGLKFRTSKDLKSSKKVTASGLGITMYICPIEGCGKEFNRPWRLAEHEHIHTGKRPFKCPEEGCNRSYTRRQHLQRHTATSHEGKPQESFKCDMCNKMMKNRSSFTKHWYRAHVRQNYKCEECGETFPKEQTLKSHSYVHTGIEPYKCDYPGCGAGFILPSRLKRHTLIHDQNRYACPNVSCSETFSAYNLLRKHVATSHPKVCDVCGKEFKKLRELKIHRFTHDSDEHEEFFDSFSKIDRGPSKIY